MTEETICCPKCKGSGRYTPQNRGRRKVISPYPDKKWCSKCKEFKPLIDFYNKTYCCKTCHANKRKFTAVCAVCSAKFKTSSKNAGLCSSRCHMERMKSTRQLREHELLPNYLTEDYEG